MGYDYCVTSADERFWAKVNKTDTCWLWTASTGSKGYGQFALRSGRVVRAHRLAYEMLVGPIPDGFETDHKCRVRRCVRPDPEHVRLLTHEQNMHSVEGANNLSGYRGVYPAYGRSGRREDWWVAQVNGVHLGTFNSIEDAAEAARIKRMEVFTHSDGR